MAEPIAIKEDGSIDQVEMTSCGLNGGPLKAEGTYPASICCHLVPKEGNVFYPFFALPHQKRKLRITQSGKDSDLIETQFIQNIQDGACIGYKYFDLSKPKKLKLRFQGKADGSLSLSFQENGKAFALVPFQVSGETILEIPLPEASPKEALYLSYRGKGRFSFLDLTFE
ncbi:MAG: beta-xylosidase, partial [Bacilli bacterium]|nr:beta-xylosidase [Bacilli bacterium]